MKPIIEYLWRPLVNKSDQQRLILVQPGSSTPAIEIHDKHVWHWPLLTSARLISTQPFPYSIDHNVQVVADIPGDEPIVAVTKDLHLVKITGRLELQLDPQANVDILANINRHFINRVLRPTIRQYIRIEVANYLQQSDMLESATRNITGQLRPLLKAHGIKLISCQITDIAAFQPFNTK